MASIDAVTAARRSSRNGPRPYLYVGQRRRARYPLMEQHRVRVRNPVAVLPADLPRPAAVLYAACLRAGPNGASVMELAVDVRMSRGVAKTLVDLLCDAALVRVCACVEADRLDRVLLERVRDALYRL